MIKDDALICPVCQTNDYLFATPSKHCTYIDCDKEEGGCGHQFVIANDGGDKIKDNLLHQEMTEIPDKLYTGHYRIQHQKDQEEPCWILYGLVGEDKKGPMEESLKKKVEAVRALKEIKKAEYKISEYVIKN